MPLLFANHQRQVFSRRGSISDDSDEMLYKNEFQSKKFNLFGTCTCDPLILSMRNHKCVVSYEVEEHIS